MLNWFRRAKSPTPPAAPAGPSVGERIERLGETWDLTSVEATHLRRVTTSSTVEKLLGTYERVIGLGREGKLSERETRMLRERILTEGTLDLDWVLQGLAWIDEVSSGDAERAWKVFSNFYAANWLKDMYQIPAASARSLWQTIAGMSEYTLSEADRIRMREEVIRKDNCLCAALSIRRYLLMAVMVYQHQAGSRLRPSEPAYASTFGFGGASSGYRQASAEDIAPQVLSREEIAGLRGRGYSLLDENAWNRLIALLRIIRLNEERIADVASLRRQMLDMTPGELASRGFDDLLWRHVSREPVA